MLEYPFVLFTAAIAGAKYDVDRRRFGLNVPKGKIDVEKMCFFFFRV